MTDSKERDCPHPGCQVPNLKEDFSVIKQSMDQMHTKQDTLLLMTADIKYIQESVKEIKERKERDHENIFSRLHTLEITTVTKTDVIIFGGALTVIFAFITLLMKVFVR